MFQKTPMDPTLIKTLTNAEIEQPNTNPSREKHCEVCCVAKIRFVVRFSSFILPYLEKYRTTMKMAQTSCVPMYIHVQVFVIHFIHLLISSSATSACTEHQITKNHIIAAETNVTTGLNRKLNENLPNVRLSRIQRNFSAAFWSTSILKVASGLCLMRSTKLIKKH